MGQIAQLVQQRLDPEEDSDISDEEIGQGTVGGKHVIDAHLSDDDEDDVDYEDD